MRKNGTRMKGLRWGLHGGSVAGGSSARRRGAGGRLDINPADRLTVKWVFSRGTAIGAECWTLHPTPACPDVPP